MTWKASNTVGNHLFLPLKIFGVVKTYLLKCCGIWWRYWCSRCGYAAKFAPSNTSFKSAAIVSLKKIYWPKKIASIIYIIWCVLRGVFVMRCFGNNFVPAKWGQDCGDSFHQFSSCEHFKPSPTSSNIPQAKWIFTLINYIVEYM